MSHRSSKLPINPAAVIFHPENPFPPTHPRIFHYDEQITLAYDLFHPLKTLAPCWAELGAADAADAVFVSDF